MILVTGATGNVGRHVVAGLREAGGAVRTLSRRAGTGDLTRPDTLRAALADVDTVFLLWPGPATAGIEAAVDLITGQARRVVYLSARNPEYGFWGQVEKAVAATAEQWTFIRPGGFATNTLAWAPMIRADGAVRWPYGAAARSLIHERDIADVAVRALLEDGHAEQAYEITGPASITQVEQVRSIGEAIGRDLSWIELPSGLARAQLLQEWGDEGFVDSALRHWASLVDRPEPVTDTLPRLTGRSARPYAQWARDHAADFR